MSPSFENRRMLLTGASGGIGRFLALRLANLGASLALVARSEPLLSRLVAELPGGPHDAFPLDVIDEDGWGAARSHIAPSGALHGIVTAAAQLPPIGPPGAWDVSEFRLTLEVNVVGTLLPVLTMLDALELGGGSVVTFSGGGATGPFPRFDAYASSKAAVVRLTENLAVELAPRGIRANAVAPGFIVTNMHDNTIDAGPGLVGADYFERTRRAVEGGNSDSLESAADLTCFLLSEDSAGINGKLLSAQWDPWQEPAFQQRLRSEGDLATLRRIDDQFFTAVAPPGVG